MSFDAWPCEFCSHPKSAHSQRSDTPSFEDEGHPFPPCNKYSPYFPERALSFKEPWTYYMLELLTPYRKCHENRRRRNKSYESYLWVHTSKSLSPKDYDWAHQYALSVGVPEELLPTYESLQSRMGGILGLMRFGTPEELATKDRGWIMAQQYAYPVTTAIALPSLIRCDGALGTWKVPEEALEELRKIVTKKLASGGHS